VRLKLHVGRAKGLDEHRDRLWCSHLTQGTSGHKALHAPAIVNEWRKVQGYLGGHGMQRAFGRLTELAIFGGDQVHQRHHSGCTGPRERLHRRIRQRRVRESQDKRGDGFCRADIAQGLDGIRRDVLLLALYHLRQGIDGAWIPDLTQRLACGLAHLKIRVEQPTDERCQCLLVGHQAKGLDGLEPNGRIPLVFGGLDQAGNVLVCDETIDVGRAKECHVASLSVHLLGLVTTPIILLTLAPYTKCSTSAIWPTPIPVA